MILRIHVQEHTGKVQVVTDVACNYSYVIYSVNNAKGVPLV